MEGDLLRGNGEHGLLVNVNGRKNLYKFQGYWLTPDGYPLNQANLTDDAPQGSGQAGDPFVAGAWRASASPTPRTRTFPIKGIVRFKSPQLADE